ncbi:MAG: hypothetical protein R2861_15455 [Desulfobacterales bacterium]
MTCNLVEHSASTILAVLSAIGIYEWIAGKNRLVLNRSEKIIIATVALYFFGALFFFIAGGLFREGAGFKWDLTMKSGFSPLFQFTFSFAARVWPTGPYGTVQQWPPSCVHFLPFIMCCGLTHPQTPLPSLCGSVAVSGPTPIPFGQLNLAFGCMSFCGIRFFYKKHPALVVLPVAALLSGILVSFPGPGERSL